MREVPAYFPSVAIEIFGLVDGPDETCSEKIQRRVKVKKKAISRRARHDGKGAAKPGETDDDVKYIRIDEAGDLLLVVGQGKEEMKLQVSSSVLCRASSEFIACLRCDVSDDDTVHGLRYLDLPDDDPIAMGIMCGVLHGNDKQCLDLVGPEMIVCVAETCYKYRTCRDEGIKRMFSKWLDTWCLDDEFEEDTESHFAFLSAAYLADNKRAFSRSSSHLIFCVDEKEMCHYWIKLERCLHIPGELICE